MAVLRQDRILSSHSGSGDDEKDCGKWQQQREGQKILAHKQNGKGTSLGYAFLQGTAYY